MNSSNTPLLSGQFSAPVMSPEELNRFSVPFDEVQARLPNVLSEYGIAIVTGVASDDDVARLEADFAQDLAEIVDNEALAAPNLAPAIQEAHKRFVEGGPRAFPIETAEVLTMGAGFALDRALPHGRFAWSVRRNPRVHAVFKSLFPESERLVTSVDAPFFTPTGNPIESCHFSAHVDQNRHDVRPGLGDCNVVQGVLYVWPASADGACATTVVWPGSHREVWPQMMESSFERIGQKGHHYCRVSHMSKAGVPARELPEALAISEGWAQGARRCVVPAGGLLLWNSRTLHTGWTGGARLAQAVCLEPVERRSREERIAKFRLAALGLPGTHWASVGMQHDCCLRGRGVFSRSSTEADEGDSDKDGVILPLRQSIRPVPLADDADMNGLAEFVDVKFRFTGMWEAPEKSISILEGCVREEYQQYL